MYTIICPNCKHPVEISEAIKHQLEEQTLAEVTAKHKKELEEAKNLAIQESNKKAKEQFELQMKRLQEDAQEKDLRIKELIEQITELTKELRQSKKEKDEVALEMQKKLAVEEDKIRLDAQKKAEEEQHLKMLAKDKQLQDAMKEVEEMRRKLQQGSQQTQGEAFELEFEKNLRQEFPNDIINEVSKGVRGGDLVQEIIDRNGNYCGKILWELKNTKTWSELWVDKLKADQRAIKADYAVIVSEVVPHDIESAKFHKGIWIVKRSFILGLAYSLRLSLIQLAVAKQSIEGKKDKMDILYTYLSGIEFKHRVEAIIEAFTNMQTEIEKEKRYFSNKWARDEKNIRQVIDNTYGMHGDLKGIMGTMLPQVKGLDLLGLEDGNEA